jgi:uncharacterized protein
VRETTHRPWPLPESSWTVAQTWSDLLFAHWAVPADSLRQRIPAELELDTWDGRAWLGITPFVVTNLRLRGTVPLPVVSRFGEVNVRTYVTRDDRPGIWFLSLDASSRIAVQAARLLYGLPYHYARVGFEEEDAEWVSWSCARSEASDRPHVLEVRYRPTGDPAQAAAGSLEHFLTERYCLYGQRGRHLVRADIHHRPWPLQPAEAHFDLNAMAPGWIRLPGVEPLVHYVHRHDAVIWRPERVAPA